MPVTRCLRNSLSPRLQLPPSVALSTEPCSPYSCVSQLRFPTVISVGKSPTPARYQSVPCIDTLILPHKSTMFQHSARPHYT